MRPEEPLGWTKIEHTGQAEVLGPFQDTMVHPEAALIVLVPQTADTAQESPPGPELQPRELRPTVIMETAQEVAAIVQVEAVVIAPVEVVALEVVATAREEAVVPEVPEVTVARVAAQEVLEAIEAQVHREAQDQAEGHPAVEVVGDGSNLITIFQKL